MPCTVNFMARYRTSLSSIYHVMKHLKSVFFKGNALINVGPTKEGIIPLIFQERLLQLGEWLKINGEAIYDTSPWLYQNDTLNPNVWYTSKKKRIEASNTVAKPKEIFTEIYAFFLKWPFDNILQLGDLVHFMKNESCNIELFDSEGLYPLNVRIFNTFDIIVKRI